VGDKNTAESSIITFYLTKEKKMKFTFIVLFLTLTSLAFAEKLPKDPNCAQVYQACQNAGFVVGEAKIGKGLWKDCVDPIMQGTTAKTATLPLPSVSAQVVSACKAHHPKFGSGSIG
jgi:hypothetical protein